MRGGAGGVLHPKSADPSTAAVWGGGSFSHLPPPPPHPRTPKMHPAGTIQGNRLQRGLFLYKSIQNAVLSHPSRCDPTGTPSPFPPPPAASAKGETEARGCHPAGAQRPNASE